jgi:hypothetical protein
LKIINSGTINIFTTKLNYHKIILDTLID